MPDDIKLNELQTKFYLAVNEAFSMCENAGMTQEEGNVVLVKVIRENKENRQ